MSGDPKEKSTLVVGKDPEWLSKYPRKPTGGVHNSEKRLDAELADSFPASDPPSFSPGTAGPGAPKPE